MKPEMIFEEFLIRVGSSIVLFERTGENEINKGFEILLKSTTGVGEIFSVFHIV
jgi:hypothetical protein